MQILVAATIQSTQTPKMFSFIEFLEENFGGFQFDSEHDKEKHITLASLAKGDGRWKSEKQGNFLYSHKNSPMTAHQTPELAKQFFGVHVDPAKGEKHTMTSGYMNFGGYGGKALRPVTWVHVFDQHGLKRQYKLGYKGDMRKGTGPDPAKTKQIWTRSEATQNQIDTEMAHKAANPAPAPEHKAKVESQHFGQPGDKVKDHELTIVHHSTHPSRFAYNQTSHFTIAKDDKGNLFHYGNYLGNRGDKVKANFTVKDHTFSKNGERVTRITRAKVT